MFQFPNTILTGRCVPTDVKIYYENKQPYLEYTGECRGYNGEIIKVYFPKIGLNISQIEASIETKEDYYGRPVNIKTEFFATLEQKHGVLFEIIEREMSKKQIEKELGYKIKLIDE